MQAMTNTDCMAANCISWEFFPTFPPISSRTYPVGLDRNNPDSPDFEKKIRTYSGLDLTLSGRALISSKHSNVSDPNKQNKIIQDVLI